MNVSEIHALGIHMLPGYSDPYHGRPLTKGELGCFLSHYNIWKEVNPWSQEFEYFQTRRMCDLKISLALDCGTKSPHIFSDRRWPALWGVLQTSLDELNEWGGPWRSGLGSHVCFYFLHNIFCHSHRVYKFLSTCLSVFFFLSSFSYIGRKRMQVAHPEKAVPNIHNLVEADYSYWTLGYMISLQGAQKLLKAEPLKRILPVDEFLPLMYNKHPV